MRYHTVFPYVIIIFMISLLLISCDSIEDGINYEISYLSITPDSLYADNNNDTFAQIDVIIIENKGNPAPGKIVNFETDLGNIDPQVETSETGHAIAIFQDNGQPGIAHISVSLENESQTITDSLKIMPLPYNITSMTVNPHTLYADQNITTSASVRITVEDNQGFPAAGIPVSFKADLGIIQGKVYTDDFGVALTSFNDNGLVGMAHIDAYIEGNDTNQTMRDSVEILSNPHLKIVSISANPDTIFLDNGITSSEISVLVQDQDDIPAVDQDVYFSASIGNIISHVTTDNSGMASTTFWDNEVTGIAMIHVYVGTADTTINVTIIDSDVIDINLDELPSESAINRVISVSASALNVIGAVPDGKEITFSTELSFFQVSEYDNTSLGTTTIASTLNGTASVYLNTGIQTGINQITVQITADQAGNVLTDSAEMEILPDEVDHLSFTSPSIEIAACDDNSIFSEICLELRDINENLVQQPCQVWYKFLSCPEGSNIENIVYNYTDSTSVISNEGEASVQVFSGTQTGIIVLQAWIRDTSGQMISAVFEDIAVQPGPPSACQLNISGMDEAEDMGGGMWCIETSAYLTDACNNPVMDGTGVYFNLDPNPDYASIGNTGCVGGQNQAGESLPGTAFGTMVYDGAFTNEMINLKADIYDDITFEQELVLPLQYGELSMVCIPIHCDWIEEGDEEDKLTLCRINVHDGQNSPINNQRIMLLSSLGDATDINIHPLESDITDPVIMDLYDWDGINEDGYPHDGYTGWYEGQLGLLHKNVFFHKYECPPPIPVPPGTTTAVITATIHDTQISVNQTITLYRYVD